MESVVDANLDTPEDETFQSRWRKKDTNGMILGDLNKYITR